MNAAALSLKILVAIVLLASAPLALKRRWRLFLAIPLCVFQGFVPGMQVAGVPIPLAFWGGLMLWPEFIREFPTVVTWKPTFYVLGITTMFVISLIWSPDRKLGLAPIGYFLQFLIIFSAAVTEGRRDERSLTQLFLVTVATTLVEAALVVVGRVFPATKLTFLLSPVGSWVVSPNLLATIFTTGHFNTFSLSKSGGMFVNANVAATFLGIMACVAMGFALHLHRRWLGLLSIALILAIAFTGSKAGLILAVAVPILALHFISLRYKSWRNRLRMIMTVVMIIGLFGWLGPKAIHVGETSAYAEVSSFLQRSDMTLSIRQEIWRYGAEAMMRNPFKGQGFGGWQKDFPRYARTVGLDPQLPPQNTIIYLWSQGGALAALLGLAFIYEVLRIGWHQITERRNTAFGLSLATAAAFLWTFSRGMGSNFGLLGEMHMSPILAGLLALAYLQRRSIAGAISSTSASAPRNAPEFVEAPHPKQHPVGS